MTARYAKVQLLIVLLMAASLACELPVTIPNSNAIRTAAAETVIAGFTQSAIPVSPTVFIPAATPTFTSTPEPPTITLTPIQTVTASLIPTSTSFTPLISVSVPTNCRIGPGRVYPLQGALLVGETAEVFGRTDTNEYWYIRNPDKPNEFCWVWGKYATLTGPFMALPIFTPPPTPTPTFTPTPSPSFDLKAAGMDSCGGSWWAEVEAKNTSSFVFKSMEYTVLDKATDVEKTLLVNGFTNKDGCSSTVINDSLAPNSSFVISSAVFDATLQNHPLRVEVTLCTELNQNGVCVSKKINFTP